MALDQAFREPTESASPSPESAAVRELLRLLVKAQKSMRLYQGGNAITNRLRDELFTRVSEHLDTQGPVDLTVREFHLLVGEEVVYEKEDRNDSLAFLLFRDGIRRLSLFPGLEAGELQRFIECLNRVSVRANEQDDLVTLFWEQDFKAIRYFAVDELASESEGPRLQDQLRSGALEGETGGGAAAEAVKLEDVDQPVSQLPVEACRLSDEEIEALRAEIATEEEEPFHLSLIELAIDLTLLEPSDEERHKLADNLMTIVDRLLAEGDLKAVASCFEHLNGLAEMAFRDSEPVQRLYDKLRRSLIETARLSRILERAESDRSLKPIQLTGFLARLGEDALPVIVPALGRMKTSAFRRALADAVCAAKDKALDVLARHLPSNGTAPDPTFLREVHYVLAHFPASQALPLIDRLLDTPDPEVRREAALLLGRFHEDETNRRCLELLNDADPEVRTTALDTLVRHGRSELARNVLDEALSSPVFEQRGLAEKRRFFAAVAKLAGEAALDWFVPLLRPDERHWFASRKDREEKEAIAHGIRMVGTEKAAQILTDLAASGDRAVRAACNKALVDRRARE